MPKKLSKSSNISTAATSSTPSLFPASLADPSLPLPKLIVFDLDYTLWPFWVDTHVAAPLKSNAGHTSATDRYGEDFAFYNEVPAILYALNHSGVKVGVASRTCAPNLARDMLKILHIPPPDEIGTGKSEKQKPKRALDVFDGGLEIYPSSKIKHFESLQKRTGLAYEDMLFFDDEARNRDTESLGVTMWLVEDGVNWAAVEKGVKEWRKRRGFLTSDKTTS